MAAVTPLAAYQLAIALHKRADSRTPSKATEELEAAADGLVELADEVTRLQLLLSEVGVGVPAAS